MAELLQCVQRLLRAGIERAGSSQTAGPLQLGRRHGVAVVPRRTAIRHTRWLCASMEIWAVGGYERLLAGIDTQRRWSAAF